MTYLLTRVYEARDWWYGGNLLKAHLLGKMARLELHHIFPKDILYKHDPPYRRPEVNAVANFCFLTKETNLWIANRRPEEYFPEVASRYPGALESHWIPMDRELWKPQRYLDFLEERKKLLAEAANAFLDKLRGGEAPFAVGERGAEPSLPAEASALPKVDPAEIPGGVESTDEEAELRRLNAWMEDQGLPAGDLLHELAEPDTGEPLAILDLAWPAGVQQGLSEPLAVLLNEGKATLAAANGRGFRYFTDVERFRRYVAEEILAVEPKSGAA